MKKNLDYLVIFGIVITCISILLFFWFILPKEVNYNNREREYLMLNNETMICDFNYICFFIDGKWHKPSYNAGVNLIIANRLNITNEELIKKFFNNNKINLVLNTTPAIVETMPFAYYLSYYYNTFKKELKEINSYTLSQYNSTEPALIILGPNPELEDSIKVEGRNLVIKSRSRESLSMLLGKLLLIIVM